MQVRKQQLRTGHGTTDWFQIGKGVHQRYILPPCLFNVYAEYTMINTGLDEAQDGNINYLRYAHDTTHMAESEEELKNLLMKEKEESEKASLYLNIQKTDLNIWFHHFMANRWETMGTVTDYFGGLQNHCKW